MIYLDNAATTKMYNECIDVYKKYSIDCFFNPSALYAQSIEPLNVIKSTKTNIAKKIGCNIDELYFTASGSEGDNIALLCTIKQKKGKVLISKVEHAAVYNTAQRLIELGFNVDYVDVDRFGRVNFSDFKSKMSSDTVFVSIMHVCNETGALNPIKELVEYAKKINKNVIFHSDGVQAFGKIPVNLKSLGVDAYTISAHKIHGPKGVGCVYIKNNINPRTFIFGGGQESNIRSATENVGGIAAFNVAVDLIYKDIKESFLNARIMQEYIINYLQDNIDDCIINTNIKESSPYIVSFSLKKARGEGIVHYLESKNIVIGTGSACSSKKGLKRIPIALSLDEEYFDGMLRISYDSNIDKNDLDVALQNLIEAIKIERELHK